MNDSRFRGPSRPSTRAPSRDPRGDYGEPGFEEQPGRSSRGWRDSGSDDDRRPRRGPNGGSPPGRRPSRPPDEGPEFERRPPRGSRPPEMNPGASPSRAPRDTEMEQPGWSTRRGESRDNQAGPRSDPDWGRQPPSRSGPDWAPGPRPRSGPDWEREPSSRPGPERRPRPRSGPDWEREPFSEPGSDLAPGPRRRSRSGPDWGPGGRPHWSTRQGKGTKKKRPKAPLTPEEKRQRLYRYLGLLALMLFAGGAGICLNYNLLLPAIPLLLVALASAGVFVYF